MRRNRTVIIIASAVVIVVVALGLLLAPSGQNTEELLDLGNRYLSELDWESAVAKFTAVLKVDPKNVEAILGLSEAYCRLGRFDEAEALLEREYANLGDESIAEKLEYIRSGADIEAIILEKIGKAGGTLTDADLADITTLSIQGRGIRDISLLAKCENLKFLNMASNYIRDMKPLEKLPNLRTLDATDNPINDLSSLAAIPSLVRVDVMIRQEDVVNLAKLTQLKGLRVYGYLTDISPLESLTELEVLGASRTYRHSVGNRTTGGPLEYSDDMPPLDISVLTKLPKLREVELDNIGLTDLTILEKCPKLDFVSVYHNKISDISPLASLTELWYLAIDDNEISDLTPLENLTNLTDIYLSLNEVNDISPLAGLDNIERLSLGDNKITDISPLASHTKLDWLYLRRNEIGDISALAGLEHLNEVDLTQNPITDWSPVDHVENVIGRP